MPASEQAIDWQTIDIDELIEYVKTEQPSSYKRQDAIKELVRRGDKLTAALEKRKKPVQLERAGNAGNLNP